MTPQTLEQFEQFLDDLTQDVESLDNDLVPLINQIVEELKVAAPINTNRNSPDAGDLKNSIRGIVSGYSVQFQFNRYGLYQNFGVMPKAKTPFNSLKNQATQPFGVTPSFVDPFMNGGEYKYKTRKFGLPARQWFDFQSINDRIIEKIIQLTTPNI